MAFLHFMLPQKVPSFKILITIASGLFILVLAVEPKRIDLAAFGTMNDYHMSLNICYALEIVETFRVLKCSLSL